jgi:hypothetical protein
VLHWDGAHWRDAIEASVPDLTGIWASSPNDLWCSARDGSVWHFDGQRWTATMVEAGAVWQDISGSGPDDIWLVGIGHEQVAHFGGTGWDTRPLGLSDGVLHAVLSRSPTDVWVAGERWPRSPDSGVFPENLPVVMHYDGSAWSERALPDPMWDEVPLSHITARGDDLYFESAFKTLHWNGATFEWLDDEQAVLAAADQTTWRIRNVSGRAELSRLDGGVWLELAQTPFDDRLSSWDTRRPPWHLAGTAGDDLWIVGDSARSYHWDGAALHDTTQALTHDDLFQVDGFGEEVWLAGSHDVVHFDGARWSKSVVQSTIHDLYVPGANRVWLVADSQVLERQGGQWLVRETSLNALWAIDGTGPNDIWVSGDNGEVRHFDGSSWRAVAADTADALYALVAVAPGEVWLGGQRGNVFHLQNGAWTQLHVGGAGMVSSLWATGENDVWAAEFASGVFHWDGSSWGQVAGLYGAESFAGTGPDDVWLCRAFDVSRFDGQSWSTLQLDISGDSCWVTPTTVWSVGGHGSILRRAR